MMFKAVLLACLAAVVLSQSTGQTSSAPETTQQTTPATTTASPDTPTVLNFTLPKNNVTYPCLKLQLAVDMTIRYTAQSGNTLYNTSLKAPIPSDINSYDGTCNSQFNYLTVTFWNNWTLEMNYTSSGSKYELSTVKLTYLISSTWFPNASNASSGVQSASALNLHEFSASEGNSFKCNAKTSLDLGSWITFDITHYQGQPFYNKADKGFDMSVECTADTTGTSKLVPIIVGSALAFLVVLVLIAYLIGRRRHRSGYQTV